MTGGVTVFRTTLRCAATKRWTWDAPTSQWRMIGYGAGGVFTATEHRASNLRELVAIIDTVRQDPRSYIVRGELTPDTRAAVAANPSLLICRLKHAKGKIPPTLVEVPRQWIMVDIDKWPLRPMDDLAVDPELAIEAAIHALLPAEFHDATCWWQLSSSAWFAVGLLKVHLFFWLTEPATNTHIRAVLEQHAPGVDTAPFNAAQPHYLATPVIDGAHDPLPRRTGWRIGIEEAVTLPALRPAVRGPAPTGTTGTSRTVAGALARLGHGEGGGGFHAPLLAATMAYARSARRDDDHEPFKSYLRARIRNAPCRPGGDVEPYCADAYLDAFITGAFARLAGNPDNQAIKPHHAPPRGTLRDAKATLQTAISGFLSRAIHWHGLDDAQRATQPPEHAAISVAVAAGKTWTAANALAGFIAEAKAAGWPHRVLIAVPYHVLGAELLANLKAIGINAAAYRGRRADVPGTGLPATDDFGDPVAPTPMCLNLDAVADAQAIRTSVEIVCSGRRHLSRPPPRPRVQGTGPR